MTETIELAAQALARAIVARCADIVDGLIFEEISKRIVTSLGPAALVEPSSAPRKCDPAISNKRVHPASLYWARFTPEERSAEMKRRRAKRRSSSDTKKVVPIRAKASTRSPSLAASRAGVSRDGKRSDFDFYVTPPECTEAFLQAETPYLARFSSLAEPFCGQGHMSKVLEAHGFDVTSTDLVDRGFGQAGVDAFEQFPTERAIVTNPPFNRAHEFIRRALGEEQVPYLALFLKSTFFNSKKAAKLMRDHPPSRLYPLAWRPQCILNAPKATLFDFQWVVWDTARPGESKAVPLMRPAALDRKQAA